MSTRQKLFNLNKESFKKAFAALALAAFGGAIFIYHKRQKIAQPVTVNRVSTFNQDLQ